MSSVRRPRVSQLMENNMDLLNKQRHIDNAIGQMLDAGIIRSSQPSWGFLVVIVDNKYGSRRFCVDCRKKLNIITKIIAYPLPLI